MAFSGTWVFSEQKENYGLDDKPYLGVTTHVNRAVIPDGTFLLCHDCTERQCC